MDAAEAAYAHAREMYQTILSETAAE
jgi:hypothetical protein